MQKIIRQRGTGPRATSCRNTGRHHLGTPGRLRRNPHGANGKSTLINTLTGIMGDYSAVAQMETFTASNIDRHPTDLAMLRGARIVTAQETEEGRRWAEAKIKSVTGGDPITARFMRQDHFTFIPQ